MTNHSLRAGVLGASGYTGGELLRYLAGHPSMKVVWVTADSNAGKKVGEVFGHLRGYEDLVLQPADAESAPALDVAFLALPHGEAALAGRMLLDRGVRVVDLSADWRLRDPAACETWYGWTHPAPGELSGWVYGLPELHRAEITPARAVASPGCYPTAAILALAPGLRAGMLQPQGMVVSAASGVSGAGRKAGVEFLFSELDASFKAYVIGTHRHTPEIEQELSDAAGEAVRLTFTPHLAPMARGLLATCFARLADGADAEGLRSALETAYKGEPFVRVLPSGVHPATKQVSGSNHAAIGVGADARTRTAVITCAIDNLGKGAAGQAIQNANLMLGLDETAGLGALAVYP
jgi:N-acetyl-gamma-glutamyl-phosphate reductase